MENLTMKLNKYLMTGALVALMGIGVVGCNENDPVGGDTTVTNVSALEANSMSSTSVALRWTASTTTGATYRVVYGQVDAAGVSLGAMDTLTGVSSTSVTVTGLTQVATGGAYKFTVQTVSGTSVSTGASIMWAPAERKTKDALTPSVNLRMYEFASTSGSGLVLDPAKGGPKNVRVRLGGPDPASVALAIFNKVADNPARYTDSFDIGPAYAMVGFANADNFDTTAYISVKGYDVNSLDELYLPLSLDNYITAGGATAGNISAFTLPNTKSDGKGVAFLMRVGNGSARHYLRVLVKNVGGKLLQGSGSDRYVEVELSYQAAANVPYAKGVVRAETPATYHSYQQFTNGR
jgi:hypothetical protein